MNSKILFSLLFLGWSSIAFSQTTIGVVNMRTVYKGIGDGKKVDAQIRKEFQAKKKEVDKEKHKFEVANDNFQRKKKLMNDKKRRSEEEKLRAMFLSIQNKARTYETQIQELEAKLKKPLIDKVRKVVAKIAKGANVDFVVEAGTSPLIYARKQVNLTKRVITQYNKDYPSKR